jgi:alpha-galactosidase
MHWVNGLQRDDASMPTDAAFTLQDRELAPGEHLVLGAEGRSSEQTVPWFAIDNGEDTFFAGLMWSGGWSLTAERSAAGIELTLGLAPMSTSVTSAVDGPHAFFGSARGDLRNASAATRSFVMEGIRGGRALDALVTYNTWFAYGTRIDEETVREEIQGAAELGAELFVMDAGWYVGTGRDSVFDFTSGLGSWEVDAARFPEGVKALTDYAHSLGLKFGIWVEPERVALSTVGRSGLAEEAWLASVGGRYGSTQAAQICLASAAARQWVLDEVERLIDKVQPDYLKWDNNFWLNCDRDGHGHGASDGNFAHVNGLYDVLAQLRTRYPDLLIENVSGGGNRLDFGMLRYSDVGWMDDRSAPSVHVRHIVEGLGVVFPPSYLLSFVMHHEEEPINDAPDLSLYFQSPGGQTVVLSAIQWDDAVDEHVVMPVGLRPESTYDVESVDAGVIGAATGAELMEDGITVVQSPDTAAHILILRRQ